MYFRVFFNNSTRANITGARHAREYIKSISSNCVLKIIGQMFDGIWPIIFILNPFPGLN